MKKFKFLLIALVAMISTLLFPSCGDPIQVDPVEEGTAYSFDLFASVGKHGGMSQNKNGTIVRSIDSLTVPQPLVQFTSKGIDITADYTLESITRGKYYYQVPQKNQTGFVKFHIGRNAAGEEVIVVDAEKPFVKNTFYARKYTHAFIDDGKTLVVIGTNGDHTEIYWTKLNEADLSVKSEGTFNITLPEKYGSFSTAGLLTYRESDKKLYYFYLTKVQAGISDAATSVTYIAVINPETMAVESNTTVPLDVMEETAGSAYGELMQNMIMYDAAGNMYVAGLKTVDDQETGILRRIKVGETAFDPDWNGFPDPEGKLLTIQYIGYDKALAYSRDNSKGTKIDSKSHFYTIIDLKTCQRTRVQYNGVDLRYCGGRFSQRSAVIGGKAYIGVTDGEGETDYPTIYVYDCKTGVIEQGVQLEKGFCFDIIRAMRDEEAN